MNPAIDFLGLAMNLLGVYAPIHAMIGTLGGRYSRSTAVFAWICIGWAIDTLLGVYQEYVDYSYWFESDVIIFVPWSILIFLAGIVSLRRLRRNKHCPVEKQQAASETQPSM